MPEKYEELSLISKPAEYEEGEVRGDTADRNPAADGDAANMLKVRDPSQLLPVSLTPSPPKPRYSHLELRQLDSSCSAEASDAVHCWSPIFSQSKRV